MEYENSLPNKIINRVMEHTGHEINVTRLSAAMKKPVPSVWNKVAHKRRWDAETWLQVLWVLGYADYSNADGGYISIHVPMEKFEVKKLNNLRTPDVFIEAED